MKKLVLAAILGVAGIAAGTWFGTQQYFGQEDVAVATLAQIELPDVDKEVRNASEWLGKVVVVNHWATWCAPCREEIPMLIDFQERMQGKGVQVVGIAHDLLDASRAFGDEIGINYPSLVAIVGGTELLVAQGNPAHGALPYTAIFDRSGNLASTKLGIISLEELLKMVKPLL